MNDIQILGKIPLYGEISTQGSKNAVLPMMAASLLHRGTTTLMNVPCIEDVSCMVGILEKLGAKVAREGRQMTIDASCLDSCEISLDYVRKMRSSIMVLGPLVARMGQAVTHYPGGCSIGKRPVDYHVQLLRDLGLTVTEEDGRIEVKADRYEGTELSLCFPSVGATENAIMAAVGARGETVIRGCAREPEIVELCCFLAKMGIETLGAGSGTIRVRGQRSRKDPIYRVCGDRIAAGTYLAAAAVTGGEICLTDVPVSYMDTTLRALCACGCLIMTENDRVRLQAPKVLKPLSYLETAVYPGFPTDMQSVFLAMLCLAPGESRIRETIFEGRFETAAELAHMGAYIEVKENCARIVSDGRLKGAQVTARDLRGGAALIVAGLAAEGRTVVKECDHVDRGYEDIITDMRQLGASVERIRDTKAHRNMAG
ncbi:MAG: UDP-N-acetylglucosamine 1-carboxyvinyltransferase [Lachnospiraceae bacterium]|nr:UDP-N-acetylglucosamine 1-carboxyvinyltransferase [Lachnospiraceae bacterium]